MISYRHALSKAACDAMEADPNVFIAGIAVDYPSGIFGTTTEALERFGPNRVFDVPAMENALTGISIGAAAMGKRPLIVHNRCDFMLLTMDMLGNVASKWSYMYGGNAGKVPVVTRAIIGRGWGQGATHSQALHSLFAHFPGVAVLMPATPASAYDLTLGALKADHPSVILEYRSLYDVTGELRDPLPIGKAEIVRVGEDLTVVATSVMVQEALQGATMLQERFGVSVEIVDPRSIRPLDEATILASVQKTGALLAADISWELCGFASEVCALVAEKAHGSLVRAPRRLTLPDCPAPVATSLEDVFYPKASTVAALALTILGIDVPDDLGAIDRADNFKGPY